MKKSLIIFSAVLFIVIAAFGVSFFTRQEKSITSPETPGNELLKDNGEMSQENSAVPINESNTGDQLIGGQKDEHGCLIGAGYSWCESKQKCLRIWEEKCPDNRSL